MQNCYNDHDGKYFFKFLVVDEILNLHEFFLIVL